MVINLCDDLRMIARPRKRIMSVDSFANPKDGNSNVKKGQCARNHYPCDRHIASNILHRHDFCSLLCILNDKGFLLIMKHNVIGKRLDNREIGKWRKSQLLPHSIHSLHINEKVFRETNLINYNALMFSRLIYPAMFITVFSIATFYFAFLRARKNCFSS